MKRSFVSEKNIVVVLFILVFIIFSFAQQDTKNIERMYSDPSSPATSAFDNPEDQQPGKKTAEIITPAFPSVQLR